MGLEGRQPSQDFRSVIIHGISRKVTPNIVVGVETVFAVGVVEGVRRGSIWRDGIKKVAIISRIRIMREPGNKARISRHFFAVNCWGWRLRRS